MNFKKTFSTVAAAALLSLSAVMPASATSNSVWATFTLNDVDYTGTFTFAGTDYAGTTQNEIVDNSNAYATVGIYDIDESEYMSTGTPMGSVFGSSYPGGQMYSDTQTGPITGSSPEPGGSSETVFTFTTPVPAGKLGIAFQDMENDHVTVTATDAAGNDLTGAEIVGTANPVTFNSCDLSPTPTGCDGETDTDAPSHTVNANSVDFTPPALWSNYGSDAWIRPSVAIKTLTFVHTCDGDDNDSTVDVSMAVLTGDEASLASTGTNDGMNLLTSTGSIAALLVGAVAVASTRRKNA